MTKTLYQRYRYNGKFPLMKFNNYKVAQSIFDGIAAEEIVEPSPEIDYSQEYLTVTSWEDNNNVLIRPWVQNNGNDVVLYYSKDKTNWTQCPVKSIKNVTANKGEKVFIKGNNNSIYKQGVGNYTFIGASKYFEISGNIMSLLWGDNFIGETEAPNKDEVGLFQNIFSTYSFSNYNWLLSARNLVIPLTYYPSQALCNMFESCAKAIYWPKELPQETYMHTNGIRAFMNGTSRCTKINESPVIRLTTPLTTSDMSVFMGCTCKKTISFVSSGYPTTPSTTTVKYKLSTNTSVSGSAYRDFDTLLNNNSFISIWAETETPYDGMVAGCGDYFIAGDSVTLEYVAVNGTFNGYYDENDNLLSSSSTYMFTAQRSMKIKVKTS